MQALARNIPRRPNPGPACREYWPSTPGRWRHYIPTIDPVWSCLKVVWRMFVVFLILSSGVWMFKALRYPECSSYLSPLTPNTSLVQYDATRHAWSWNGYMDIRDSSDAIVEEFHPGFFSSEIRGYDPNHTWGPIGHIPAGWNTFTYPFWYTIQYDHPDLGPVSISSGRWTSFITANAIGNRYSIKYPSLWSTLFHTSWWPIWGDHTDYLGVVIARLTWWNRSYKVCFVKTGSKTSDEVRREILFAFVDAIDITRKLLKSLSKSKKKAGD